MADIMGGNIGQGAGYADGGHLLPPEYHAIIFDAMLNTPGLLPLIGAENILRVEGRENYIPIVTGTPTAYSVEEANEVTTSAVNADKLALAIKEFGVATSVSKSFLADLKGANFENLLKSRVANAFADKYQIDALGRVNGANYTGSVFNTQMKNCTQKVNINDFTGNDAFAKATSAAMALVNENGEACTGMLVHPSYNQSLRDTRKSAESTALAYDLYDPAWGMQVSTSKHLNSLNDATPAAGKVLGVVGNFQGRAHFAVRDDMTLDIGRETQVEGRSALLARLLVLLWTQRVGFVCSELNSSFALIVNEPTA